jgi:hypothetical protein
MDIYYHVRGMEPDTNRCCCDKIDKIFLTFTSGPYIVLDCSLATAFSVTRIVLFVACVQYSITVMTCCKYHIESLFINSVGLVIWGGVLGCLLVYFRWRLIWDELWYERLEVVDFRKKIYNISWHE